MTCSARDRVTSPGVDGSFAFSSVGWGGHGLQGSGQEMSGIRRVDDIINLKFGGNLDGRIHALQFRRGLGVDLGPRGLVGRRRQFRPVCDIDRALQPMPPNSAVGQAMHRAGSRPRMPMT